METKVIDPEERENDTKTNDAGPTSPQPQKGDEAATTTDKGDDEPEDLDDESTEGDSNESDADEDDEDDEDKESDGDPETAGKE